ncbi:MAG TPA: VOC family protein [Solirubrobacterales bacterium]|nr:VOC family protein [Solirubrobacterales bacterium]
MLHHVSIEVHPDQVDACVACWELLGFKRVEVPEALGPYFVWLEHEGTQIHLIITEAATVPLLGHPAVAVDDFEATFAELEHAGFEPERHRELWGQPRAFVTMPGGHRVEMMAAPPTPTV